jgi:hypothetical protein
VKVDADKEEEGTDSGSEYVARVHEEEVFLVIACCKIMLIF